MDKQLLCSAARELCDLSFLFYVMEVICAVCLCVCCVITVRANILLQLFKAILGAAVCETKLSFLFFFFWFNFQTFLRLSALWRFHFAAKNNCPKQLAAVSISASTASDIFTNVAQQQPVELWSLPEKVQGYLSGPGKNDGRGDGQQR